MKLSHYVVNGDNLIALIYDGTKFGKVVVFTEPKIDLNRSIDVYNQETGQIDKEDVLDLVLGVLPNGT